MIRYHTYLEGEPDLEAYRLSHEPRSGYGVVFICPFAVVTGESGRMYQLMRGFQGRQKGEVVNFGIYEVTDVLDEQGPLYYSFREAPPTEPYWVSETDDYVEYAGSSFAMRFGPSEYEWTDASGQVELRATRLGDVCTFWVPAQDGLEHPQMLRSHAGRVSGRIGDDPVDGLFMLDYIYSRPDLMWNEMGMMSKLHNLWLNWLVEYEDGTWEGGYAWRGRPGSGFAAAHHIVDGVSQARTDAKIETFHTERGAVSSVRLELGDVTVELQQRGSQDWPLHTCGDVVSTSRGKAIANSWNYTEFFPTNYADVLDYFEAYAKLFGRPHSFRALMRGGRIVDQRLVFQPDA